MTYLSTDIEKHYGQCKRDKFVVLYTPKQFIVLNSD